MYLRPIERKVIKIQMAQESYNVEIRYFNCQNNNSGLRPCTKTHYIRQDFLEQVILGELHRLAAFANEYENDFVKAVMGHSAKVVQSDRARKQKALDALAARDKELDRLFERLYEDNVSGKISDERFAKMSRRYEQEQGENVLKIKSLRVELEKDSGKQMTADMFLDTVRQYSDAQKLTRRMLTELIDHIDVYHAEQVNGVKTQKIAIFYNCIGEFSVPERRKVPNVDILLNTRKGVAVSYSPAQIA